MHNRAVRKWVTLCCSLPCRWALAVVALSVGIVFVATAFDLRVNTTLLASIGLYREKLLGRRRVGSSEFNSVGFEGLGALRRRALLHPSGLASALLDPLWRSFRHGAGE